MNAFSKGLSVESLYNDNGWYNDTPLLKESFYEFMSALVDGEIVLSDLFSNTQVMTGEVISGIASTASIFYYKDTITYPDNTTDPINLEVYPLPQYDNTKAYATVAGVGLAGYKTTDKKKAAITKFVKWFTEATRNLEFSTTTGYMPAHKNAFDQIDEFKFEKSEYRELFVTLNDTIKSVNIVSEPLFKNYYSKLDVFNSYVRTLQKTLHIRFSSGQTKEMIIDELWEYFLSVK